MNTPSFPPGPDAARWIRGWRLDRLIHVGKTACVYRATSEAGVVGAVKALRPAAIVHRTAAERFAREIAALSGLTHPAIPRLLDQGIDDEGLPWFVTEWIVGWDLETHRVRLGGRLLGEEVFDVGVRLLEALAHAHAVGFIHHDVKPANLFLTETGEYAAAAKALSDDEDLYRQFSDDWTRLRQVWLKGKVAYGLDRLDEAERAFLGTHQGFLDQGIGHDAALASLDLALFYLKQGGRAS